MKRYRLSGFSDSEAEAITYAIKAGPPRVRMVRDALIVPAVPDPAKGSGFVHGAIGGVLDSAGSFVQESGQVREVDDRCLFLPEGYQPAARLRAREVKGIYAGVIFDHFGHFLLESLSRLWLPLQDSQLDRHPILFLTYGLPLRGYHNEFFDLLGIRERVRVVRLPTMVDELVVPDTSIRFHRSAFREFKSVFTQLKHAVKPRQGGNNRIYVSRIDVTSAVTVPEREVEEIFRSDGWDIISPETMPLRDQISCFRSATRVAGISGSGMHNTMYCDNPELVVYINRFPILLDIFFLLDDLFDLPSLHIRGFMPDELEPFEASGPFLLDVADIHERLVSEGVVARKTAVNGFRATKPADRDAYRAFWNHRRSEILYYRGRGPEGLINIEEAIRTLPKEGLFRFQLSACRHALQDSSGSLLAADEAIQAGYNRAQVFVHAIELSLQTGNLTRACAFAEQAVCSHPRNGTLLSLFARVMWGQGRLAEALTWFQKARDASPDEPTIRYMLAYYLLETGEWAQARQEADEGVRLDPSLLELRLLRCRILIASHCLEEARKEAQEAICLDPGSGEARIRVRQLFLSAGAPELTEGLFADLQPLVDQSSPAETREANEPDVIQPPQRALSATS